MSDFLELRNVVAELEKQLSEKSDEFALQRAYTRQLVKEKVGMEFEICVISFFSSFCKSSLEFCKRRTPSNKRIWRNCNSRTSISVQFWASWPPSAVILFSSRRDYWLSMRTRRSMRMPKL